MLKHRKDKKMATKLSTESQLLQISRDDLDFNKNFQRIDERKVTKNLELVSPNQINRQQAPLYSKVLASQVNWSVEACLRIKCTSIKCISIKCISSKCTKIKLPISNEGDTQQVVLSLTRITIMITQRMFLVGMISRMSMMLMKRNIKIFRNINFLLNESSLFYLQS